MDDRDYLPLSWLSQAEYCLRRAALLLNERVWAENEETAKGRYEHMRVHDKRVERRGDRLKLYECTVFSETLGIWGKCDCIEAERWDQGCRIKAADFPVRLYPIEYKHGSVREEQSYMIQLCAQAMCLEEMFRTEIATGAIFFISAHRRLDVTFDDRLRARLKPSCGPETAPGGAKHTACGVQRKCKRCSLHEYCMPKTKTSAMDYCKKLALEAVEMDEA